VNKISNISTEWYSKRKTEKQKEKEKRRNRTDRKERQCLDMLLYQTLLIIHQS